MADTREIGIRLNQVMERLNITAEVAAQKAHIESDDVKLMRKGRKKPHEKLLLFLESLGAHPAWILDGTGEPVMSDEEKRGRELVEAEATANRRYFETRQDEYSAIMTRIKAAKIHEGFLPVRSPLSKKMLADFAPVSIELLVYLVDQLNFSGTWILTGRGEVKDRPWSIKPSSRMSYSESVTGKLYDPKWSVEMQARLASLADDVKRQVETFQRYMRLPSTLQHPEMHALLDRVLFEDETGRNIERIRGYLEAIQKTSAEPEDGQNDCGQ